MPDEYQSTASTDSVGIFQVVASYRVTATANLNLTIEREGTTTANPVSTPADGGG